MVTLEEFEQGITLSLDLASYLGDPPKHRAWHINRWTRNNYYKKENDYIRVDNNYYLSCKSSIFHIHKDCFKHPLTSYAIAAFEWSDRDESYKFEYIGDRPLDLKDNEQELFRKLIKEGFNKLYYGEKES